MAKIKLTYTVYGERLESIKYSTKVKEIKLEKKKITDIDLSPLKGLTRLQTLRLDWNYLRELDLSPLQGLTSLQFLGLSMNVLFRIDLSPLQGLTRLQTLMLDNNQFGGLDLYPLQGSTNLQRLWLRGNRLYHLDLSPLQGLTRLQHLKLNANRLRELDLSPLFYCPKLVELDLDDEVVLTANRRLQGVSPVPLALQVLLNEGRVEWQLSAEEERRQREEEEIKRLGELAGFREERLRNMLGRVKRIPVAQLAKLLQFRDADTLVEWMLGLPPDTPLQLDGDHVVVREGTTSADIDQLVALIQQVEDTPETRRSLKSED